MGTSKVVQAQQVNFPAGSTVSDPFGFPEGVGLFAAELPASWAAADVGLEAQLADGSWAPVVTTTGPLIFPAVSGPARLLLPLDAVAALVDAPQLRLTSSVAQTAGLTIMAMGAWELV